MWAAGRSEVNDGKRRRGWELCTWKKKEASQTRGGVQGRRGGRGWRVSGGLGKRSFKQRELVFSFVFFFAFALL